jgi:serine/threonine protein kinase/tetratricopeptide (TPR) repeat protein
MPLMRHRNDPQATTPTVEASDLVAGDPGGRSRDAATPIGSEPGDRQVARAGHPAPVLHRVAQFVLLERLGAGGMGVVYAAFDEKLERKVAIKLVATHAGDERAQARLLREAQAQARLSHPNVVTVYEVGSLAEARLFIAMELVKGQTLRAWQQAAPRTWQEVVALYAAAGEGLAAAHRSGIVHRDFKPDNVLIGEDGRPRVADFGLAFAADPTTITGQTTAAATPAHPSESTLEGADSSDGGTARGSGEPAAGAPQIAAGAPGPASTPTRDPDDPIAAAARNPSTMASDAGPRPSASTPSDHGRVAGTPGYMAPEQIAGAGVDARTDQFAFCIALYEALHGHRPTADMAFIHGERTEWRRNAPDAGYPGWLWDVLMRGLAHEPRQRFASMDALLGELTRRRERARRRALIAAAAVGVIATAGMTYATIGASAPPPPCPAATAELAGIWDAAAKLRIRAAVLATATPFAANVWTSTEAAFDRYAASWLAAQQAACEATNVRHVQSAELLDRRTECLEGRRRSFAAAAEVMQTRAAQASSHASEILASLGDIGLCADTGALLELGARAGTRAPLGPETRRQIDEVRSRLAQATALLATGDVGNAEPKVAEADRLAKGLDQLDIAAEIQFLQGRVKLARGEVADSIAVLNKSIAQAVTNRQDELAADIYLTLATRGGSREQRPAEIELWLSQGEAWLRRLGHASDPRRIGLERARGNLQLTAGDPRTALDTLSRALATAETLWGKTDPRLIPLLRDRAVVEARLGQAQPAIVDGERARDLGIQAWGPDYPDLARTRRSLGLLYIEQLNDVKRGEAEILAALKLYRAQLGPDSIEVANCEQGLSQAAQYRGDYVAGLEHAENAERILGKQLGADHPRHGEALMSLAAPRFMLKDYAGSLAASEAAYPIVTTALGAGHTTVGLLLTNKGEALLALGRPDAAQTDFEKSLAILQKALGRDNANVAFPLKGLGLAQLQRGNPDRALPPLERALALRTRPDGGGDPQELAQIQWGLARALAALNREPGRVRELANAALAGYRGLGASSAGQAQEISQWLHKRAVTPE